jgi:chromatin assembly factor 1 subunit B
MPQLFPQEIFLHGSGNVPEYVFSCDVSKVEVIDSIRVATGGADRLVRIWSISSTNTFEFRAELSGHQKCVNIVRFSSRASEILASGSDDGQLLIWKYSSSDVKDQFGEHNISLESWILLKKLNCLDEISHISWSGDGAYVACSLTREMSIVFEIGSGRAIQRLDGHSARVLGVAWDPLNEFIASQSADRSVRLFMKAKKKKTWYAKAMFREIDPTEPGGQKLKLFLGEAHFTQDPTASFFKRLEFSPDGTMLVTPGGLCQDGRFACHLFSRMDFVTGSAPAASIPCLDSPCIAVRFNSKRFNNGVLVFAVVCVRHIAIFRSDQTRPIVILADFHCTAIVDASWNSHTLVVCSTDGYASIIVFSETELGTIDNELEFCGEVSDIATPEEEVDHDIHTVPVVATTPSKEEEEGVAKKRRITPMVLG